MKIEEQANPPSDHASMDSDSLDAVSAGAKKISSSVGKGGKNAPADQPLISG